MKILQMMNDEHWSHFCNLELQKKIWKYAEENEVEVDYIERVTFTEDGIMIFSDNYSRIVTLPYEKIPYIHTV